MFDHEFAEVYDLVYHRRGKDYRTEAAELAELIRDRTPGADSLLDVACGTAEHLVHFPDHFAEVEGLELSAGMLSVARAKATSLKLHEADMCDFDLGRRYDAVTCLFSSVVYLGTLERMRAAVSRMAAHLSPGGVVVVEPWWSPDRFIDRYVAGEVVDGEGVTVARVARNERINERQISMDVHFVVANADRVRHFDETHVLALFTNEDYLSAFADAGCDAEFLDRGPGSPGLYLAVRS
jgi:SAM-dependent methyltransferase